MLLQSKTYESLWKRALDPDARGWDVTILRLFLPLARLLFQGARWTKHAVFRTGLFPRTRLPVFTLSVGNLTVGGAGKTPFAIWATRLLSERFGKDTVVLNRGFRSGNRERVLPLSRRGELLVEGPFTGGDEARLLARSCPRASVVVGKVRARTGRWACESWPAEAVVLDDAFQYWRLERDLDVVVINGIDAFGNGRLFPEGPLREPFAALGRADLVVVSHRDAGAPEGLARIDEILDRWAPKARRAWGRVVFSRLRALAGGACDMATGAGRPILVVTGVARPSSVPPVVGQGGVRVVGLVSVEDHHRFGGDEWRSHETRARDAGAEGIVVTAKDEVNMSPGLLASATMPVWVVDVEGHYEGRGFDLEAWMGERLGACSPSSERATVASCPERPAS